MSSLVFVQDPRPRAGEGVVVTNDLAEEILMDCRDAYGLALRIDPAMSAVIFAELRAIRREKKS